MAAAQIISERLDIAAPAQPESKDAAVQALERMEALVAWLEQLARAQAQTAPDLTTLLASAPLAELEAVPGIGEATARRIKKALEEP
jgi:DNA uptake protein ComE-like DNA-binding protein